MPNDDVFLQVFAGACEAGWASIIGDMRWKKREIEARLKQTSPDFIIADKKMRKILADYPIKVVFSDDLAQWVNSKSLQRQI